jgi:DNA-binding response OmpR family regulator
MTLARLTMAAKHLKLAKAFLPEVILLAIRQPKPNGYDACHRIREQQWGRGIVAITGGVKRRIAAARSRQASISTW